MSNSMINPDTGNTLIRGEQEFLVCHPNNNSLYETVLMPGWFSKHTDEYLLTNKSLMIREEVMSRLEKLYNSRNCMMYA